MRARRPLFLADAALALIVTLALTLAGWAHRLPDSGDSARLAAFSAYVATGGTVDALCGARPGKGLSDDGCPLCRMPGVLPLPACPDALREMAEAAAVVFGGPAQPPAATGYPAFQGRAPPRA